MAITHGLGTTGNAAGTVTPLDHKLAQLGLVKKLGNGTNTIRPGLFWEGNATIVAGRGSMGYDVAPFTAALSRSAAAGAVLLTNDATVTVTTAAAPASNSRYDVVYVWQREYSLDGTDSSAVIGVVNGTASATPSIPSLSGFPGAIALATVLVPAGIVATNAGATITQAFPITTTDGSEDYFPDIAARDRSVTPSVVNQRVRVGSALYASDGTQWVANDTGWLTAGLTFNPGWNGNAAFGWPAFGYRKVGNRVSIRGTLARTSWTSGDNPVVLPTGFWPTTQEIAQISYASSPMQPGSVTAAGIVVVGFSGTGSFVIKSDYYVD